MKFPAPISDNTLYIFRENKAQIEAAVVERSLNDKSDIEQHGKEAQELIKSGIHFTSEILESAMCSGEMALLKDQIDWSKDRLVHDLVMPAHIINRFHYYMDAITIYIPEENAGEILPYLQWMIQNLKESTKE